MKRRDRIKRGVAASVVLWAILWPFAHRVLVSSRDVNPWKLGGWAMYTTPTPPVLVALLQKGEAGLVPLDETRLPEPVRERLARFRVVRHALGQLTRPESVAREVLAARPDLPWVVVAVQRMKLDPRSARMTSTRDQYLVERSR